MSLIPFPILFSHKHVCVTRAEHFECGSCSAFFQRLYANLLLLKLNVERVWRNLSHPVWINHWFWFFPSCVSQTATVFQLTGVSTAQFLARFSLMSQSTGGPICGTGSPFLTLQAKSSSQCIALCLNIEESKMMTSTCAVVNFDNVRDLCEVYRYWPTGYVTSPHCTGYMVLVKIKCFIFV